MTDPLGQWCGCDGEGMAHKPGAIGFMCESPESLRERLAALQKELEAARAAVTISKVGERLAWRLYKGKGAEKVWQAALAKASVTDKNNCDEWDKQLREAVDSWQSAALKETE